MNVTGSEVKLPSHDAFSESIGMSSDDSNCGIKMAEYPWHIPMEMDTEWAQNAARACKSISVKIQVKTVAPGISITAF